MKAKIAYFGGEPLGVPILEKLLQAEILPELVVCSPDRPAGRGMHLVPPGVKSLAQKHEIEVFQPESYKDEVVRKKLEETPWDLFVVVAYNFILPKWLLDLPKKGCINVHPSLLPALRGPSPIRTAILNNEPNSVGVTVMLLDQKMDTGPILEQEVYVPETWPVPGPQLDQALAELGGNLLAKVIPEWLTDRLEPQKQDHTLATYTKKFVKGENELHFDPYNPPDGEEAMEVLCKINAWTGIGDTFFMHQHKRIKIKDAGLTAGGELALISVVPEDKKEMSFSAFLQSLST